MSAPSPGRRDRSPPPRDDGFEWASSKRDGWPRKALLLVNRHGTCGRSELDDGVRSLHEAGIEATPEMPHEPGRIPARDARDGAAGCDMIVLGGGDGTLSHALDAVLATRLPLGILPMGNANDLARTLNIPSDPQAACRIIAEGRTRPIDVGRIERADSAPIHFFNVASIGLSVRIARRLTRRPRSAMVRSPTSPAPGRRSTGSARSSSASPVTASPPSLRRCRSPSATAATTAAA